MMHERVADVVADPAADPAASPTAAATTTVTTLGDEIAAIYEIERLLPEIGKLLHHSVSQLLDLPARSWPQMRTIGFIYHHGPCPLRAVAAGVGVSVASASEMVERLVDEGIVQREPHPSDRRQVLLSLTPRAIEVGEHIHRLRFAQVTHALHAENAPAYPALLQSLRVLVDALRRDPQEVLDWVAQEGITIPSPPQRGCTVAEAGSAASMAAPGPAAPTAPTAPTAPDSG